MTWGSRKFPDRGHGRDPEKDDILPPFKPSCDPGRPGASEKNPGIWAGTFRAGFTRLGLIQCRASHETDSQCLFENRESMRVFLKLTLPGSLQRAGTAGEVACCPCEGEPSIRAGSFPHLQATDAQQGRGGREHWPRVNRAARPALHRPDSPGPRPRRR